MIPELRRQFLARWSPDAYARLLRTIEDRAGVPVAFRISETPVFYPPGLLETMERYGRELCSQLADNREYRAASDAAIPSEFRVPNEPDHPLFVQADFGLVRNENSELEPRLVEIQGFPSIYFLQEALAQSYQDVFDLSGLSFYLNGLTKAEFRERLRRAICGHCDPSEVVLLEIDPHNQKTAGDFYLTERALGIRICPVDQLQRQGRTLSFDGKPVRRIYNRVIFDELVRTGVRTQFEFRGEVDVEWAGHPNWFYRLSKFSLPYFKHPCVPETFFLHELPELPDDLDHWVLKPLFSFAGLGVRVGPTRDEINAIPQSERAFYILQRRMKFVPTLDTPDGPTVVETRIMYVHNGADLEPLITVVRTGRGKMMGVDYNRDLAWVGASAGFYSPAA